MRHPSNTSNLQLQAYVLGTDEPRHAPAHGLEISIKAASFQTGGAFNLFALAAPAGFATPMHIHYAEDVAVFVLEGLLTVFCGDEGTELTPGSYSFMPRGTPHGFRVAAESRARVLYLSAPGGIDDLASDPGCWKDITECLTTAARFKIEVLGPLPD